MQFNILNKAKQIGISAQLFGYCVKARWYFICVFCPLGLLIFSSHMYCTFARGGGLFPFTGNAYLQCNKTLTDKEKVRKKIRCIFQNLHLLCVLSKVNMHSALTVNEMSVVLAYLNACSSPQLRHNRGSSYLQSSPEYAVIILGSGPQPAWFLA